MIYVELDNCEPDEDWLDRADDLTQNLLNAPDDDTRKTIIDNNENMWGELKQFFGDCMGRKCWYSESIDDSAHCHLDHFRPKKEAIDENGDDQGGYWWLAFEWRNYRYSGPAENIRKKAYFHVNANKAMAPADAIEQEDIRFLDPCNPDDPNNLCFDSTGTITPKNSDVGSREYIRSEYTIRRMNLNKQGLVEGRKDVYRKVSRLIRDTQKLLSRQSASFDMARQQVIKSNQRELLRLANKFSPYSAAAKYCLRESSWEWALNIAIAA